MGNFMGQLVVVLTGIIGVALVAVLVSKNANTSGVIDSSGNALSNFLGVAVSPVTGGGSRNNGGLGGAFGGGINLGSLGSLQF